MTEQTLFWIFAILAGGGAIGVVILQDIVRMAFSLIISLGSTAGPFFLLGADFVAATQLLVNVGGTLVLLIFGVMLTASGPFRRILLAVDHSHLAPVVGAFRVCSGDLRPDSGQPGPTDWKQRVQRGRHRRLGWSAGLG